MKKFKFIVVIACLFSMSSIAYAINLKTPKGNNVSVSSNTEYYITQERIDEAVQYILENYDSRVTIIGLPSTTYNCHNYAWSMTEGNTTHYWMPDPSEYMDDGSYVQTFQILAEKVYYYAGSHSAVPSPTVSGMYESKWGSLCLVRHPLGYGPASYQMSNRRFYRKDLYVRGHNVVSNSYSGTFSVGFIPYNASLTWTYSTGVFTKLSSSGTNIVLKPKTTSTNTSGTLTATFKDPSNNVIYTDTYTVYANCLPSGGLSLRVVRSSDGVEVYPSYVGLCPNTYYYAYLSGSDSSYSYNWSMNHATVYNSNYNQAYFKTDSEGWTFLDLYATDPISGVTDNIYGVTLYGGSSCD